MQSQTIHDVCVAASVGPSRNECTRNDEAGMAGSGSCGVCGVEQNSRQIERCMTLRSSPICDQPRKNTSLMQHQTDYNGMPMANLVACGGCARRTSVSVCNVHSDMAACIDRVQHSEVKL